MSKRFLPVVLTMLLPASVLSQEDFTIVSSILQGPATHVLVHRDICYVAMCSKLLILDTSNPSDLKPIARLFDLSPGAITDIFAADNYVYVVKRGKGLVVVDISDRSNPKEVGSIAFEGRINSIYVADGLAYVTGTSGKTPNKEGWLKVIDLSDPGHPRELSTYNFEGLNLPNDIWISKGIAYVAVDRGLQIMDFSDPLHPSKISFYTTNEPCHNLYIRGKVAYFTLPGRRLLEIVDISDPSDPKKLGEIAFDDIPTDVELSEDGRYAYVATIKKLVAVDIGDTLSPKKLECYYGNVKDISLSGDLVYIAAFERGLNVVDVSDPSRPEVVSSYETGHTVTGVWVSKGYAYVAYGSGGLRILDISVPSEPRQVGRWEWEKEEGFQTGAAKDVCVSHNIAYLLECQGPSLYILDVSDPTSPEKIGFCDIEGMNYPNTVRVSGNHA